ncbi:hypothetical protein [Yersinia enterocolitica]|uniref:hypothetical protein n=1 Tax=Yersinia enterocolitica TaxID=630 RepID=UPI002DD53190|nr:hypothetical protein [Yersinia enterocolitica]EME2524847.1 hypothetical protein [Yersinia enterocolitica]
MEKVLIVVLLLCTSIKSMATVPSGKIEKPFVINNEVICLKEIQREMTPFLKTYEEENGVKYKYVVKSGLSYKDTVGLRLQINRVDSGLNVRVADLDYYWIQERGSMCEPTYMVLDRSQ